MYYDRTCRTSGTSTGCNFFGKVADHIVRELRPTRCSTPVAPRASWSAAARPGSRGLRHSTCPSTPSEVPPSRREPYCRVGSLTEPLDERYDLITCVEVVEHIAPADGRGCPRQPVRRHRSPAAVDVTGRLRRAHPPQHATPRTVVALLANHDYAATSDTTPSYLSPWASLYRHSRRRSPEVVRAYDRSWWRLRLEVQETPHAAPAAPVPPRRGVHGKRRTASRRRGRREQLRKEVLRLRDLVVGKEAELASALGSGRGARHPPRPLRQPRAAPQRGARIELVAPHPGRRASPPQAPRT